MALDPTKASNAVVAVVDLYAAIVNELLAKNAAQAAMIQRLGEQIRVMSGGGSDERTEERHGADGAGDGA